MDRGRFSEQKYGLRVRKPYQRCENLKISDKAHITIVSSDFYTQQRVRYLISPSGVILQFYLSGEELLNAVALDHSDCLLLESRLTDIDGLALFTLLKDCGIVPPTIILAGGGGGIDLAIQAMKAF